MTVAQFSGLLVYVATVTAVIAHDTLTAFILISAIVFGFVAAKERPDHGR